MLNGKDNFSSVILKCNNSGMQFNLIVSDKWSPKIQNKKEAYVLVFLVKHIIYLEY